MIKIENWYQKEISLIVTDLQTELEGGLNAGEIEQRLQKYGPNKLQESTVRSPIAMFFDQFKNVLVIILLVSALISALLGEISDAVVIGIILILNATLGVVQEYKAEKSLDALKEMAAPEAVVIRAGNRQKIEASQLVPGDIVVLEAGDYVPADLRLTSVSDLKVEESILTGESVPVEKDDGVIDKDRAALGDQRNMAFMGTAVTYGRGSGIVVGTGMNTEMGQIAGMLDVGRREPTPLQKRLDKMGRKLGLITLFIVIVVILAGLLRGIPFLEIFMTGISLAVAAVPEGLPAVVTIVLALGVQKMIKKHAIIRRLPAVETLGATTVICSDKTGTLTQNQMTVKNIYLAELMIDVTGEGYIPEGRFVNKGEQLTPDSHRDLSLLLKAAALCNNAQLVKQESDWDIIGDPTEGSLIVTAAKAGYDLDQLEGNYPRIKELPFDSGRKRMSTIHDNKEQIIEGEKIAFVKGAPDEILKICNYYRQAGETLAIDQKVREEINQINHQYADQALRVLAVAYKSLSDDSTGQKETAVNQKESAEYTIDNSEQDLTFLGLMGMIDPPRREVADSVSTCKKAGIRPVMITGDYSITARAIAAELGIYQEGDRIVSGAELEDMSQQELERVVLETTVFARVSPRHKSRIVNALQKNKQVVAMTGDGVNDAPALKESDIGVAMGITGTDVSREAADMVLTDDNFASIVAAVGEGRAIYENIKKFIRFLLSCNIGEIIALFIAIVAGMPSPLIPIQILWVNLVTDGFPALALGVDPSTEDLMKRQPRDPQEGIFAGKMGFNIITQGILLGLLTLSAYYIGLINFSLPVARTMAFGTLGLSQLWQSLNSRSNRFSLFKIGLFSNRYLLLAITLSAILQLGVMLIPPLQIIFEVTSLTVTQWLIVILASFAMIPFVELMKFLRLTYS